MKIKARLSLWLLMCSLVWLAAFTIAIADDDIVNMEELSNAAVGNCAYIWGWYEPDSYIYISGNGIYICRYGYTGELAANTTWRGDVYLYDILTVPEGLTLTIQPGTEIHMFAGAKIVVDGSLIAEGTSSDSIKFFALGANPQAGDWGTIHFSLNSTGSFEYCSIRDAAVGIEMDISSTVEVNHSLLKGCDIAGVYCEEGNLTVDHSRIDDNGIYGIYSYIAGNTITNTMLVNSGEYGIYMDGSYGWSNVLGNTIDCLGQPTQAGIMIRNADAIRVENTEVSNYENSIICYNSDAEITDCDLSINEVAVYSQQHSRPTLRWCLMSASHIGIKTCTYGSADAGRVSDWGWCSFGFPYPVNNGYYIYHIPGLGQMSPDTLWAQYNWFSTPTPDARKFYAGAPNVIMWRPYLTGAPPPKRDPTTGQSLPLAFSVQQNFPNPFNPQTAISFALDEAAFTVVTVYNIMGQRVANLLSAEMEAGEHAVIWNGRDEGGSPVSSGIYFYTIQAGEHFESRKMVMVR